MFHFLFEMSGTSFSRNIVNCSIGLPKASAKVCSDLYDRANAIESTTDALENMILAWASNGEDDASMNDALSSGMIPSFIPPTPLEVDFSQVSIHDIEVPLWTREDAAHMIESSFDAIKEYKLDEKSSIYRDVLNNDSELLAEIESWCPSYCARRTDTLLSLNSAFDNGNRHGRHYRWSRSTFLTAFGEPAIKSIMKSICESDDAGLENFNVQISQLGGCMGDVSSDATAFHHRSAAYEVHAIVVSDTEISRKAAQSVASFSSAMATHGSGGYVNISSEPSLAWFEQAYGGASKMKRILNLKASCDPENFFGHNALGAAFSISNSGNVGNQNSQWGQAFGAAFGDST